MNDSGCSVLPPTCMCRGAGWIVKDVRYGHPDFGKPFPCACTRDVQAARARLAEQGELAKLTDELGALAGCTFGNFDAERVLRPLHVGDVTYSVPQQQAALEVAVAQCETYAATLPAVGGLFIYGSVGAGKSHLAAAIANYAARQGIRVAYASAPALLRFIRNGFADNSSSDRLDALTTVPLLVLDDLGAQQRTAWSDGILFELINARYQRSAATVYTSNFAHAELEERIGDRLRMAESIRLMVYSYRALGGTK